MTITVLGAGSTGAPVVRELCARSGEVEQVQVCDTRSQALERLHDQVDVDQFLRSFQVDVRDTGVLSQIVKGSDCVISCVPADLNPELAELCLDVGVHFCDLGGTDALVEKELALDEQAREKGVWIVPNCGLAPGLINVVCLHGIDQLDRAEAAHLRVGDVPLHPEPPFNFRISWSAERILADYTNPARLIEDGQVVEADALSREEEIQFEEPFGKMEAFCTQGGLSTLTDTLAGHVEALDHKTIRWPGHAHQMRFVLGLGLAEERKIGVRTHLTYRDLLVRRMRKRLGGDHEDAVLMRVLLRGEQEGRPTTLVYEMVERYDTGAHQTAVMRCTAIPTVVSALFLAREKAVSSGGADVPENVIPRSQFLDKVADRGLNIQKERHDEFREITAKRPLDGRWA
ncbi:MAG: saccharopine dehydrogenase C-terminal domain-containing protein [Salinibacter sp.]|uniref:saccharopine dehydrogenase family protein n=1 Tax=Salinibacter sp. TaxID=2065818 RepID=UPI002FC2D841